MSIKPSLMSCDWRDLLPVPEGLVASWASHVHPDLGDGVGIVIVFGSGEIRQASFWGLARMSLLFYFLETKFITFCIWERRQSLHRLHTSKLGSGHPGVSNQMMEIISIEKRRLGIMSY